MAIYARLLILLTILCWLPLPTTASEKIGCLACHPQHYVDMGSCVDCHRGEPGTQRISIAHYRFIPARFAAFTLPESMIVIEGQKLLQETACRRCHVIGDKGNTAATNLDRSFHDLSATELYAAIREPAFFMPDFRFTEEQLSKLVNTLQAEGNKLPPPNEEIPLKIHFEDLEQDQESVFEKHCGGCHRVMTQIRGGLGRGNVAPNLSGLLSEFYPKNYPDQQEKAWTPKGLEAWLKNPRKLKGNTNMPPAKLKKEEMQKLIEILTDK